MMGKQIRVYLEGGDFLQVQRYVEGELSAVLMPDAWVSRTPQLLNSDDLYAYGKYICPKQLLSAVNVSPTRYPNYFRVDALTSPVIEWSGVPSRDGKLPPGRFYYIPNITLGAEARPKDEAYLACAGKLFRWVRKITTVVQSEWGSKERLGPEALTRLQSGEIELSMI